MRVFGAMVIAALVAVAPADPAGGQDAPPAAGSASATIAATLEAEFVGAINALRSSQGLPSLSVHPNLVDKARSWAAAMAVEGRIWHSTLANGIVADWKELGENVGMGPSVASLHAAFVASPSHYANLVRADFTHVGVGVVVNPDGTLFVAEEFMTLQPVDEAQAATPSAPAPSPDPPAEHAAIVMPADSTGSPGGGDAGATVDHLEALLLRLRALDG